MKKVSDSSILILIFLVSLLIYVPYIQSFDKYSECRNYQSGDSWWYEMITVSILEDGDVDMSNNIQEKLHVNSQLAMSKDGCLVPKHSIFFSISTIPFYLIFGPIGAMYYNLILIVILNLLIYQINRVFFNKNVSLITCFLFATGTILLPYSYNFLAEVFSTVLFVGGVLLTLKKNYFFAAIIFGFSCFAKVSNVPWVFLVFLFIAYDLLKNKAGGGEKTKVLVAVKEILGIGIIFLISLTPLLVTNYLLYGGVLTTGYHRAVSLDENFNLLILNGSVGFNQGLFEGMYKILFHPVLGVIEANPVILVSVIGIFFIKKLENKMWLIMLICIIIGQFVLFAKWDMWYATEFGNRFLMTSIVLLSPFAGNIINLLINRERNKELENEG